MSAQGAVPGSGQAPAPSSSTENDRLMAALAYILNPLVSLIILLTEAGKTRGYQRFHAIQALGLFGAAVIYEIAASIVYCALSAVSAGLLGCIVWVLFFAPIVPFLYYAYLAFQGKEFEIPVVTPFMRQQKWL